MKNFQNICLILFLFQAFNSIAQGVKQTMHPESKYVLYVNSIHLVKNNYTLTLEKFISSERSFKIMLSGGEKENYVAASFDMLFYPCKKTSVSYLTGLSLMGYESPIETGLPVHQPMNKFFESEKDQYYSILQVVNGVLIHLSKHLCFELDGKIGPAYNISESKFLWSWSININLGIPFD